VLRDGREPARDALALTRRAALCLGHLEHGRPPEVAALGALGGLEVLEAVAPSNARGAALETLDGEGVHARSIGVAPASRFPCLGEKGRPRLRETQPPRAP